MQKGHKVTIIEKESDVALEPVLQMEVNSLIAFSDPLGKPSLLPKLLNIALNRDLGIQVNIPLFIELFKMVNALCR